MQRKQSQVTRKALAFALAMTAAVYGMLFIAAGAPAAGRPDTVSTMAAQAATGAATP